jgi:hypothetical protein
MMIPSSALLVALVGCALQGQTTAFSASSSSSPSPRLSSTSLSSVSRREAIFGFAAANIAALTMTSSPEPASAKYSDYTRREKDWDERMSNGEIKVSSARSLKTQLREIAPMNTGASQIFCPNGPSAAVSPLMENKCGDRLATPSVYGRQNDAVGNSIPGFKDGFAWGPGESSSLSAGTGGFPSYKEGEYAVKMR